MLSFHLHGNWLEGCHAYLKCQLSVALMLQNLPKETSVISTTWHAWEHKESKHCGGMHGNIRNLNIVVAN